MHLQRIEPEWVAEQTVLNYHREQLAEHGGGDGVRDMGLLQSALARPQSYFHYNQITSLARLAACYGYGIAKNHAFVDGNKRTAYVVMRAFLIINGFDIRATAEEKYLTIYDLAAGHLTENQLAEWIETKLLELK